MEAKVFEIKEYMIVWRQLELLNFGTITAKVRALVRCTGGEYTMDVYFLSDDSPIPEPKITALALIRGRAKPRIMPAMQTR